MGRINSTAESAANAVGMGPVTRERVNVRAHELAVIAGRPPPHVTQIDYEQAKREVTGESDIDRQEAMLESVPETERRDSALRSTGLPLSAAAGVRL